MTLGLGFRKEQGWCSPSDRWVESSQDMASLSSLAQARLEMKTRGWVWAGLGTDQVVLSTSLVTLASTLAGISSSISLYWK